MDFDPGLKLGQEITHAKLVEVFKCGNMGGMRRSKATGTLVIVSDDTKGLYQDKWEKDVLHYTGMGKIGDQVLTGNQNETLYNSDTNGIEVHLFEVTVKAVYTYKGIVKLDSNPYQEKQPDDNGNMRMVWMFPLKTVSNKVKLLSELDTPEIRLIPMSAAEFNNISIKEIQEQYFLRDLISREGCAYYYRQNGLNSYNNALLLFQANNTIIASARLDEVVTFDEMLNGEYKGSLNLYPDSIQVFEPITREDLQMVCPKFTGFTQSKQYIENDSLNAILTMIDIKSKNYDVSLLGKKHPVEDFGGDAEAMDLLAERDKSESVSQQVVKFLEQMDVIKQMEIEIEILRNKFVEDFIIQKIMNMTLEEYVVGLQSKDSFCYRIETQLLGLGDIRTVAGSKIFGVYYSKDEAKYVWTKRYGENLKAAFNKVKEEIVMLIMAGNQMNFEKIKDSMLSPLLKGKILYIFYPMNFLDIYSITHLDYFLNYLGIKFNNNITEIDKQKLLLEYKNNDSVMIKWTPYQFGQFLYSSFGRPTDVNTKAATIQKEKDDAYPRDYVSNISITIEQWKTLLQNHDVFTEANIEHIKRIYKFDNHAATCYDMGIKYGQTPSSYIQPIVTLGKRISNELELPPIIGNDGKEVWWRIPFWGKYNEDDHFEWKLRPKLAKAIELLYPELTSEEVNLQADDGLIIAIRETNLSKTKAGFVYEAKPKEKKETVIVHNQKVYLRDRKTAINALSRAFFKCEIDANHPTFKRKNEDVDYTEPHHLVPMSYSDEFDISLDVEANIISLCSNCHNHLHYGKDIELLLNKLFEDRKELLPAAGIIITFEMLQKMYR